MILDEILEILESKNLDIDTYCTLYKFQNHQDLFDLAVKDDVFILVEYLYVNCNVKFYLSNFTSYLDPNLLNELNSENTNLQAYKISYKNGSNESLDFLNYYKRFSKCNKDKKGFFYTCSQNKN